MIRDELVLDSGSVSTACPYAWCSDSSVNDGDKVYLQDVQQRRIPMHGSRVVPLELWGPEGRVECKVKFDVAEVACLVVSLGKMIESGFTFIFDDYKCYMHKDNQRVEIFHSFLSRSHLEFGRFSASLEYLTVLYAVQVLPEELVSRH